MTETPLPSRVHIARVSAAAIELVRTAALLIEATAGPAERDWFLQQLTAQLAAVLITAAEEGPAAAEADLTAEAES